MWVKINIIDIKEKTIYVPKFIAEKMDTKVEVIFGQKRSKAIVKINLNEASGYNSYEKPYFIQVSSGLSDELLMQTSIVYQIKISYDFIEFGPVIGLLLGNHCYSYSPSYMNKYSQRLKVYERMGGLICAFSPNTINFKKNSAYGLFFNVEKSKWQYSELPLPNVIYRRGFHCDEKIVKKLIYVTKGKVFNSRRFSKYELYEYIDKNIELKEYQPPTKIVKNFDMITDFIDVHKDVILKPISLSRGRGICIIEKDEQGYNLFDYRNKECENIYLKDNDELKNFFSSNKIFLKDYIIQKKLNLCKINKSVFDVRVVMQKTQRDIWQCSGIECRISKENTFVTNISKGGYPLSAEEALRFRYPDSDKRRLIISTIKLLCFKLCAYLDKMNEHFAELGIDIALDEEGKLWIIEANVLPGFDGFKQLNHKVYSNIKYIPLLYATTLENFRVEHR